jgi:hypothetical protein
MHSGSVSLALAVLAGACARAYPPPGGEQDTSPPRLASVTPEALAVLPSYTGPVVFRFDERVSERGFSESLVVVSPLDGALRVDRGRREVRVRIDGGWRPNRVYRVIIEPGLRDMFGNERKEAVELVFSTGPPVPTTAIAGIVEDRLSGRGADAAVVTAVRRADTVSYMALADSGGFFALRYLPLGVYDLRAYSDQNRNRRRDFAEAVDSGRSVSLGSPSDTITVPFTLIPSDTTPPRVNGAEAVDSLHVRVSFDDYLEPEDTLHQVSGQVVALPDSTPYARVVEKIHPTVWERQRPVAVDTTVADTVAVDTVAVDTVAVDTTAVDTAVADTLRRRAPPRTPPRTAAPTPPANDTQVLPNRDLILKLDRPLQPGRYVISVTNATNLNGLTGGGADDFQVRPAPTRPPARPDTISSSPSPSPPPFR